LKAALLVPRVTADPAALIAPAGSIALRYRRNQPQWHGMAADSAVYRQGTSIED